MHCFGFDKLELVCLMKLGLVLVMLVQLIVAVVVVVVVDKAD